MKDNTYVAITLGLLLGVCLLVLIGAAPIQHWLEIPGAEWGAYDSSSNQLFKVRVSDKAFTLNGVLDAGAGIRAHGTIDAASQTVKANVLNASSTVTVGNTVVTNGGSGGFYFFDRAGGSSANNYIWYANGGGAYLWDTAVGANVISVTPYKLAVGMAPLSLNGLYSGASGAGNLFLSVVNEDSNEKVWGLNAAANTLYGRVYTDDLASATNWLQVNRGTGAEVSSLYLPTDVSIGSATTPITGYDLTVNNGTYSGGTIYGSGTISGQTIADRTVGSPDDALSEIRKMKVIGDEIDHTTLGLARSIRELSRISTVLYDKKSGKEIGIYAGKLSEEEKEFIPDEIYIDEQKTITQEEERNLSRLASMLTRAIQQLDERITALEAKQ